MHQISRFQILYKPIATFYLDYQFTFEYTQNDIFEEIDCAKNKRMKSIPSI